MTPTYELLTCPPAQEPFEHPSRIARATPCLQFGVQEGPRRTVGWGLPVRD